MSEDNRGSAIAVKVDGVTAPALKSFDAVKATVTQQFISDAKEKVASDKATSLLQAAKGGASLASIAKSANAIVAPVGPFAHSAADKGEFAPIVAALFDTTQIGESKLVNTAAGPALIQLSEIIPPAEMTPDERLSVAKTLEAQMQNDFRMQYEYALRATYPVKIDQSVLEQVKGTN